MTKFQCFPALYRDALQAIKLMREGNREGKDMIYKQKRSRNYGKYTVLVKRTIANFDTLERTLKDCGFFEAHPNCSLYPALIVLSDLVFSELEQRSGPTADHYVINAILSDAENLVSTFWSLSNNNQQVAYRRLPVYYAFVNTFKTDMETILSKLEEYGFFKKIVEPTTAYSDYVASLSNLTSASFLVDPHFGNLLCFSSDSGIASCDLVKENQLLLITKAAQVPIEALKVEDSSVVLDACAAPGNKSFLISQKLKGTSGKLFCSENHPKRFSLLQDRMRRFEIPNKLYKLYQQDFLAINYDEPPFSKITHILLDPSCSGSGMLDEYRLEPRDEQDANRSKTLSNLQAKMIRYAFKFPNVKRIVYSTCSTFATENEDVVREVLSNTTGFRLVPPMENHPFKTVQIDDNPDNVVLRFTPDDDCTIGFFVAVFERIDGETSNGIKRVKRTPKMAIGVDDGKVVVLSKRQKKKLKWKARKNNPKQQDDNDDSNKKNDNTETKETVISNTQKKKLKRKNAPNGEKHQGQPKKKKSEESS